MFAKNPFSLNYKSDGRLAKLWGWRCRTATSPPSPASFLPPPPQPRTTECWWWAASMAGIAWGLWWSSTQPTWRSSTTAQHLISPSLAYMLNFSRFPLGVKHMIALQIPTNQYNKNLNWPICNTKILINQYMKNLN